MYDREILNEQFYTFHKSFILHFTGSFDKLSINYMINVPASRFKIPAWQLKMAFS